jgi:hypothetical protein
MAQDIVSFINQRLVVIAAGLIAAGVGFELLPIAAAATGAMAVLLTQAYRERQAESNLFLTSPLFLLGTISLVFFVFILAVANTEYSNKSLHTIESFYGSDADRMFVLFGMSCIVVHSLIAAAASRAGSAKGHVMARSDRQVFVFAAIAAIVSLANIGNFVSLELGGPGFETIRSVASPVLAFSLIGLAYQAVATSGRNRVLIAVTIVLVLVGMFFILEGKKPILIATAGVLYVLRLKKASIKNLMVTAVALVIAIVTLLEVAQTIRVPAYGIYGSAVESPLAALKLVIDAKLVLRQAATRYCVQNVIDKHAGQEFSLSKQLFWLKGLVPRLLWPDKPSLSLGEKYAWEYCGATFRNGHSSSITLLGQPVIHGGFIGLMLHATVLLAALAGVVWLSRNPETLSTMASVAILPWLIDFEQDFALYMANAVKFLLAMTPLIFIAARLSKHPSAG